MIKRLQEPLRLMSVLLLSLATPSLMQAQTFTTLYNFTGSTDGGYPYAGLVQDKVGNLYGTAANGGDLSCQLGGNGCGVVFKIDTTGKETVLHVFRGGRSDGCEPYQNLTMDEAGNLYGTTPGCGASNGGTVFKLTKKGKETLLHSFAWSEGATASGMLRDASGNFYGLTEQGGTSGRGVLYKLTKDGTLTVLHNFAAGTTDGCNPGALTMDKLGNFYGTTSQCGSAYEGTAWKVSKNGTETILHNFGGGSEGCFPLGGVVRDSHGNLSGSANSCGTSNHGTLWELSKSGSLTVVHDFSGTDGANPSGSLLRDAKGGLYGTSSCSFTTCYGTVWAYK